MLSLAETVEPAQNYKTGFAVPAAAKEGERGL